MINSAPLKVARWLALTLAVAGLAQTPFVIPEAVSEVIADRRLIVPYLVGFTIRFLFIGFFAKFWWDTRTGAYGTRGNSKPKP